MIRLHGLDPQGDQRCPGLVQRDGVHLMVRRAPSFSRTDDRARACAGSDLRDVAGGHRGPDDVVSAVVLAGDSVQALDVDGVGALTGGSSSAPQVAHFGMVFTSR